MNCYRLLYLVAAGVLIMVVAGQAQAVVVFQEDFSAPSGTSLADLGWTSQGVDIPRTSDSAALGFGDGNVFGSDTSSPNGGYSNATKAVGHVLAAGQYYEITWKTKQQQSGSHGDSYSNVVMETDGGTKFQFIFRGHRAASANGGLEFITSAWGSGFDLSDGHDTVPNGTIMGNVGLRVKATPTQLDFYYIQGIWGVELTPALAWNHLQTYVRPVDSIKEVDELVIGNGWQHFHSVDSLKIDVIPEPATLVVLSLGGLAALIRRRR